MRYDEPEILDLIDEMAVEVLGRYDALDEVFTHEPESYVPPHGLFLAALRDGRAVGCGGYRAVADGVVELKRMYVQPASRGLGLARRLLAALEEAAAAQGASAIRLETGLPQPDAIALYASTGYVRIPGYGEWADDPLTVCMEKALTPRP